MGPATNRRQRVCGGLVRDSGRHADREVAGEFDEDRGLGIDRDSRRYVDRDPGFDVHRDGGGDYGRVVGQDGSDRFDEVGIAVSVARRGWVPAFWVPGFAALSFTRLQERPIE